jgi:hypothetical protein
MLTWWEAESFASSPHKINNTKKTQKGQQPSEIENDTVKREIAQDYISPLS